MLNEDFEMITNAQKKKIWVEVKKLGYEKEDFYELIENVLNKKHMSELTKDEAKSIIDFFVKQNEETFSVITEGMMTKPQRQLMMNYILKLGWSSNDLSGFIKKYAHIEHVNWLTLNDASKIIEGLKNIYNRKVATNTKTKSKRRP